MWPHKVPLFLRENPRGGKVSLFQGDGLGCGPRRLGELGARQIRM